MDELFRISLFPILLTLGCYQIGLLIQKKLKSAACNPILISVILILAFMAITGMENGDYQAGTAKFSWLLTPATICLAIPMYQQLQVLKKHLPAIAVGVAAGAIACMGMVAVLALLFGFDRALTMSLLPKSVTSAIGVPLCELAGGIGSITTAVIILTGIFANITGRLLCRVFRIREPIAQGVAFGTSGHVVGTAKASELSELTGAVSSLSLVVAGLVTAVAFSFLA